MNLGVPHIIAKGEGQILGSFGVSSIQGTPAPLATCADMRSDAGEENSSKKRTLPKPMSPLMIFVVDLHLQKFRRTGQLRLCLKDKERESGLTLHVPTPISKLGIEGSCSKCFWC